MLIVLDNCEHLIDACAEMVDTVMAAGGSSKVLATSREWLDIDVEQVFQLRSLDTSDADSSAVQLFVQRARALVLITSTISPRSPGTHLAMYPLPHAWESATRSTNYVGPSVPTAAHRTSTSPSKHCEPNSSAATGSTDNQPSRGARTTRSRREPDLVEVAPVLEPTDR